MFLLFVLASTLPMISLQMPVVPPQEVPAAIPEVLETISEALESVPAAVETVQEALENVPAAVETVQEALENVPAAVETVQEALESVPAAVENVEETLEKLPVPAALEHVIETLEVAEEPKVLVAIKEKTISAPQELKSNLVSVEERLSKAGVVVVRNPKLQGYAHRPLGAELSQMDAAHWVTLAFVLASACMCVKVAAMVCCMRTKKVEEA